MKLHELVEYLDGYLRVAEIPDYPGALNGLQVEGTRDVHRIAVSVTASEATVCAAGVANAGVLLVYPRLSRAGNRPVTGRRYRLLQPRLASGVALYTAHHPLDMHPDVGNTAQLALALCIELQGTFGPYQGVD